MTCETYTHIRMQVTPFKYNKKQLALVIFLEIYWVSQLTWLQNENRAHLMTFLTFCLLFFSFFSASSAGLNVGSDSYLSCLKKKTIILNQRFWQHRSNNVCKRQNCTMRKFLSEPRKRPVCAPRV